MAVTIPNANDANPSRKRIRRTKRRRSLRILRRRPLSDAFELRLRPSKRPIVVGPAAGAPRRDLRRGAEDWLVLGLSRPRRALLRHEHASAVRDALGEHDRRRAAAPVERSGRGRLPAARDPCLVRHSTPRGGESPEDEGRLSLARDDEPTVLSELEYARPRRGQNSGDMLLAIALRLER